MPVEVRIDIGTEIGPGNATFLKENRNKIRQLEGVVKSLRELQIANQKTNESIELLQSLVKKFLRSICKVTDHFFLTDICKLANELFLDFRLLLGHWEDGRWDSTESSQIFEDLIEESEEILDRYCRFMMNSDYNAPLLPKPAAIRSMRELAFSVDDGESLIQRNQSTSHSTAISTLAQKKLQWQKRKLELQQPQQKQGIQPHFGIQAKLPADRPKPTPIAPITTKLHEPNKEEMANEPAESPIESPNSSDSSVCSASNLLKDYSTPSAPILLTDEMKALTIEDIEVKRSIAKMMSKPSTVTTSGMANRPINTAMLVDSVLSAVADLMPARPERKQFHHDDSVVSKAIPVTPKSPKRTSFSLQAPLIVDEEGDVLPSYPPPANLYSSRREESRIVNNESLSDDYANRRTKEAYFSAYSPEATSEAKIQPEDVNKSEIRDSGWRFK